MSIRWKCIAVSSTALLISLLLFSLSGLADELQVQVGKQSVVLPEGSYGLKYFPDEGLGVLSTHPLTFLVAASDNTYLFYGRRWEDVRPISMVINHGTKGDFDNGYAGVGGVYKVGHRILAFYHAEDREGQKSPVGVVHEVPPFYASVGLAASNDDGRTFQKLGQVLTSKHPRKEDSACAGIGEVSVCVDKTNKYLMAYYTDYSRHKKDDIQISVARCPIEVQGRPGHWKKYCNGDFSEPGLGGDESHVLSLSSQGGGAYSPCVIYRNDWHKYVMVFCLVHYLEVLPGKVSTSPTISGIYISTSDDGIGWGTPLQLFAAHSMVLHDRECVLHPTLIIESGTKRELRGSLVYGYTPHWPVPHYMARRQIVIQMKSR